MSQVRVLFEAPKEKDHSPSGLFLLPLSALFYSVILCFHRLVAEKATQMMAIISIIVLNNSTKWEYPYYNRENIESEKEYAVCIDKNDEKVYTLKANGEDTYSYDTTWQDKLKSYNGQAITYDASGNPLNYRGHTLTWEYGRQLAGYDDITYTYNEDGIRTSKTVDGETTNYYLYGTQLFEQANDDYALHFFYDRNGELAGFIYYYLSTGVDDPIQYQYYYVKNVQGDITGITDIFGNLVAKYEYDAWGKLINVESYNGINDPDAANVNPFRYRGYYYDTETGLYYLQSRYYDPETGRFINCDDVDYIGINGTIVSYNPFAYCENNPIDRYDPYGNSFTIAVGVTSVSIYAVYKAITLALTGFLCVYITYSLYSSGALNSLGNALSNYVKVLKDISKEAINDLKKTINNTLDRAKNKIKTNKTNNHHIIAKADSRANQARSIWVKKLKLSINDPLNLVALNQNFHQSLHTKIYYTAVNIIISNAYRSRGKDGVLKAMAVIRTMLLAGSNALRGL